MEIDSLKKYCQQILPLHNQLFYQDNYYNLIIKKIYDQDVQWVGHFML